MASSKSQFHIRSNSFPSNSHPLIQECIDHLQRLRSSNGTCSSSSSLTQQLRGLEDLHECVGKLLQLQLAQQAFSQSREEKWIDQLVDGSLRLLDGCNAAKDAVLHTKEYVREIQSIMRRRRGAEVDLDIEIKKYSASRKVVKKEIQKALRSLKGAEGKTLSSMANQDNEMKTFIGVLKEAESTTLAVFESLLSFISGPKTQNKLGGWSLVSKLVNNKRVGCEVTDVVNEFAQVDIALQGLMFPEMVQKDLQSLDLCIHDFEERLESMFRRMIKTRVSLLNILNN